MLEAIFYRFIDGLIAIYEICWKRFCKSTAAFNTAYLLGSGFCASCFIYFVLQPLQHEDEQPVQPEPDELTNLLDPPSPFVLNPKTEYFF